MPRKPKPAAPGAALDTEAMIRVDHAGEYGAVRIYEGQLAVLKRRKDAAASDRPNKLQVTTLHCTTGGGALLPMT